MDKRFNSNLMKPEFHKKRMNDLDKLRNPSKVFVGSSGDMFGNWITDGEISTVLIKTLNYPQHTFQFLTKNPGRYYEFSLDGMDNCWFGTTVDGTWRTENNLFSLIRCVPDKCIKFVSFEPLINKPLLNISHFKNLDWIIIGADSTRGATKPPKKWADYLVTTARNFNIPVFVKDNYKYPEVIKEFPEIVKHE